MCFLMCFGLFALPAAAAGVTLTYGEDVTIRWDYSCIDSCNPHLDWYQVSDSGEETKLSNGDGVSIRDDYNEYDYACGVLTLTGLDAGTYTYTAKGICRENHGVQSDFNVTVSQKKLNSEVQTTPTAKTPSPYTGVAQPLVEAGVPTDQPGVYGQTVKTQIEYALGDNDTTAPTDGWSTTAPTPGAGTYYVWWRVAPESVTPGSNAANALPANYAASDPTCIPESITILPADIVASVSVDKMTCTGQPQTPNVTVSATTVDGCPYTVTYSTVGTDYSDTLPTFTEPGSYPLYVKISAPNHNDLVEEATVEMSAPTPTPAPTAAPTATPAPQSPKTGDEANLALWLALATLSVMAAVFVVRKKKAK